MDTRLRAGFAAAILSGLPSAAYLLRDTETVFLPLTASVGIMPTVLFGTLLAIFFLPRTWNAVAWTALISVASFIASVPTEAGFLTRAGVPMLLGACAGSRSLIRSGSTGAAERLTFSATFLGMLLGGDVAWLLVAGPIGPPGMVSVIGGAGLADGLIVGPVLTTAWVGLWGAVIDRLDHPGEPFDIGLLEAFCSLFGHRGQRETQAWMLTGWFVMASYWAVWLVS